MATENTLYAFFADYSSQSDCLYAIQQAESSGAFDQDDHIVQLLSRLENDLLKKLYLRTIRILGALYQVDGVPQSYLGGDFTHKDFLIKDFNVGRLQFNGPITDIGVYLAGDFLDEDFTDLDFWTGFQGLGSGYAAVFKTIINVFTELKERQSEISNAEKWVLDTALIPFLDALEELKDYLQSKGFNLCANTEVAANNNRGVFLQASGANGSDGVAEGIHLRWALSDELGNNHIPKGDYYNSRTATGPFNRANDYVHIFRTPYLNTVVNILNFEAKRPIINSLSKTWSYLLMQQVGDKIFSTRINLIFEDTAAYNSLALSKDPGLYFYDFLNTYPGVIRLELSRKSAFKFSFDFTGNSASRIKAEAKCFLENDVEAAQFVRNTFSAGNVEILADNIRSLRYKKTAGGILHSISFETYDDFIKSRGSSDWREMGTGFGLSLNDNIVFERLENDQYPIDNLWPQYNDGTRVRVSNYEQKWLVSEADAPSLKDAVLTYLSLSESDPRALDIIKKADAGENDEGFQISYVDVLNLQASDYHMARMLGLGFINTVLADENEKFIYQLRYLNRRSLSDSSFLEHHYTSLPVSKQDSRLPAKPNLAPVSYGLPSQTQSAENIFDAAGYASIDRVRAVNIKRAAFSDESLVSDFFDSFAQDLNENIFTRPKPVAFGLEYRAEGQTQYQKPEIIQEKALGKIFYAYDDDYPGQGIVETALVPDDELSLYIHFERRPGVHYYAAYGVNWFSRASILSDEVATDETVFAKINTLTPPEDLAVQYIQKEDVPVLTTTREQNWLSGRENTFPGEDTALTRLSFNFQEIIDISAFEDFSEALNGIVKAKGFKTHFNPALPIAITGAISTIAPFGISGNQLVLQLGSYKKIDGSLVSPTVGPADFFRFSGASLSTPAGNFRVIEMIQGTTFPRIVIEKNKAYSTISDPEVADFYGAETKLLSPESGSRFTLIENLSKAENWHALSAEIEIYSFADENNPIIETFSDSEGNLTKFWIGGIHQQAIVSPLFGNGSPEDIAGLYKISFDASFVLPEHPQNVLPFDPANPSARPPGVLQEPFVEWYKGILRLSVLNSAEKKSLEVLRIEQGAVLTLYVLDSDYLENPIVTSADENDSLAVNFHPGYRVYYFAEPSGLFNSQNILPLADENERKSLIGLQSFDDSETFYSAVSIPAVLMARNIIVPLQPELPVLSAQRVRADQSGKASLTFDTKVKTFINGKARKPFGMSFFRGSFNEVLSALYSPTSVIAINQELSSLTQDNFASTRMFELINLIFDESTPGSFKVFDALPAPYGFPIPDKAALTLPEDSLLEKKTKYASAILSTLLPLNEQVPIFSFIKTGFQTQNTVPVIRDIEGNLLSPDDPDFNPFPMVRKFTRQEDAEHTWIRFTDYFLNQSSREYYFYAACETTNELLNGEMSLFSGPVSVINSVPPEIPVLAGLRINPAMNGEEISVEFNINPLPLVDEVTKIRIYRSTSSYDLERPSKYTSYFEYILEDSSIMGFQVTDKLDDLTQIPYGETLFYRFYSIRTILNEFNELEDIFSAGSSLTPIQLIDTRNPSAPDIFYNQEDNLLWWVPVLKDATYSLYQQNNRGNWQRIFSATGILNQPIEYPFPEELDFQDEEGNRLYYRFKVSVENSSGLTNLEEKELTI